MSNPRALIRTNVRTESGQHLGTVADLVIDQDTQTIRSYVVRAHRLLPSAVNQELVIDRTQVVGFDNAGMIVEDATLPKAAPSPVSA